MKRKIAMLAVGAMLAVALLGGGVYAYFSDIEQSQNNQVTAGTLDLVLNGGSVVPMSFSDVKPGDHDSDFYTLLNDGSINGALTVNVDNVVNNGGLWPEPEQLVDADNSGDLDANMHVIFWIDTNHDGIEDLSETELYDGSLSGADAIAVPFNAGALNAHATNYIGFYWEIDYGVGNVIQGDGVTFDVIFTLTQA